MMMMNASKEVLVYYLASFKKPRVHFHISNSSSDEWQQYIMTKSECSADAYEVSFSLENDSFVEFVICSGDDHEPVVWENPRGDRKQKHTKGNNFFIATQGEFVIYQGFITPIRHRSISDPTIICTDIDGTLYGENPQLHEDFKFFYLANGLFLNPNISLVYSTGRNLESFKEILKSGSLLYPNALITSCGTEVYQVNTSESSFESNPFELNMEWAEYITSDNWQSHLVYEYFQERFPELMIRESMDNKYKAQFVALPEHAKDIDRFERLMKQAHEDLSQNWKYIVSGCGTHRFIDILPEKADKGSSLEFLCKRIFNVQVSASAAFGDSMNDADMLASAGRSFIVANAQKDLIYWYKEVKPLYPHINLSIYPETTAILKFTESLLSKNRVC